MDIRDWPIERIMQLPDWCFGRQWLLFSGNRIAATTVEQWLVKPALPDKIVLWEFIVSGYRVAHGSSWWKLALGDHEPASDAEFDGFERVFSGDFDEATEEGALGFGSNLHQVYRCRTPLLPAGRRFCLQARNGHGTSTIDPYWSFLISSIPTEVPDWLVCR